ncbi:hypothetical protein EBI_27433 [Enterocytozoon bieneusi H348]|nr:hypothetical protein EBI_27433 [Enterocytozoon bieneusi H348]|eukprot:XP_002649368.1 hypothetical protein EBI_27433 [Enterocytozoon bieneusi H348]
MSKKLQKSTSIPYSFIERLKTFDNWPRKYSIDFILNLCISGLYSKKPLETNCIYCDFHYSNWTINDDPIMLHLNSKCILFQLNKKPFRTKYNKIHGFSCNCKAICFELYPNKKYILCGSCGDIHINIDNIPEFFNHKCCSCTIIKKFGTRGKSHNFYSDLFHGKFNKEIYKHLETVNYEIPDDKMDIIEYLIATNKLNVFEPTENIIEAGLARLSCELESEMRTLEEYIELEADEKNSNKENNIVQL